MQLQDACKDQLHWTVFDTGVYSSLTTPWNIFRKIELNCLVIKQFTYWLVHSNLPNKSCFCRHFCNYFGMPQLKINSYNACRTRMKRPNRASHSYLTSPNTRRLHPSSRRTWTSMRDPSRARLRTLFHRQVEFHATSTDYGKGGFDPSILGKTLSLLRTSLMLFS